MTKVQQVDSEKGEKFNEFFAENRYAFFWLVNALIVYFVTASIDYAVRVFVAPVAFAIIAFRLLRRNIINRNNERKSK